MKDSIAKTCDSAAKLTIDLLEAHGRAVEINPMVEFILLDLLKLAYEVKNKLTAMEGSV